MKKLKRCTLMKKIESLMVEYCDGCFLNKHLKEESGRRFAHRFCISQCTVGNEMKEYGKKLT
ncbi:MAG TPA: zinc-finger domain-containing protein [Bacillales bacterium]|nr:zinc-finger domain-containing protein [Bacillales bacterium]